MSSKRNRPDFVGGGNMDQSWIGATTVTVVVVIIFIIAGLRILTSCSTPKVIHETVIEYRDRVVHDTTSVEVPHEVEKIVTLDTVSHLENNWAKSDASVSGGLLSHSLESKPRVIKVPVEVHVTDTLYKEAEIIEKEVEVEKPLSWWQKFRMEAFWALLVAVVGFVAWKVGKLL